MIAVAVERRGKAKAGGAFLAVVADGSAEEHGDTESYPCVTLNLKMSTK